MPRGYWRVILALGCLIVIGLGYLAYQELQGSEIDTYPDAKYQPARNATFPPAPNEHQAGPEHYDPHCQDPTNKDDSDLCAQWSSVEAVNESNRLVRISLNVVALEFGALVVSLIFTGWAAFAAAQAARAANLSIEHEREGAAAEAERFSQQYGEMKRSADAAETSIKESRRIGDAQIRAYVGITKVDVYFYKGTRIEGSEATDWYHLSVLLTAGNGGRTPARRIRTAVVVQKPLGEDLETVAGEFNLIQSIDIRPEQTDYVVYDGNFDIPDALGQRFLKREVDFILSGHIVYDPVVGPPRRETPFAYLLSYLGDNSLPNVDIRASSNVGEAT